MENKKRTTIFSDLSDIEFFTLCKMKSRQIFGSQARAEEAIYRTLFPKKPQKKQMKTKNQNFKLKKKFLVSFKNKEKEKQRLMTDKEIRTEFVLSFQQTATLKYFLDNCNISDKWISWDDEVTITCTRIKVIFNKKSKKATHQVILDVVNPDDQDFKDFIELKNVKMEILSYSGPSGHPEVVLKGKKTDLCVILIKVFEDEYLCRRIKRINKKARSNV